MQKSSLVLVYTGDGKGKTSAAIGLCCRALGAGKRVAFVQFIKSWQVSEHTFFANVAKSYSDDFTFYKGGKGFFHAGKASAKNVSDAEHEKAARETFAFAKTCAMSGEFDLVICDEINNAVADGLLSRKDLEELITSRNAKTSLCLTGRHFPAELLAKVDIATEMKKIKHHYDNGYLATEGIDY